MFGCLIPFRGKISLMTQHLSMLALAILMGLAAPPVRAAGEYLSIKANGNTGVVTNSPSASLVVTIEIYAGDYTDMPADWWILAETAGTWYTYNIAAGFGPGFGVSYQGGLQSLSAYEVLRMSSLPVGTYTFYFGIDTVVNGQLDVGALVYQSVTVVVNNSGSGALIQPADLVYLGAFRLPEYPADPEYGWEWGGNALTYYPAGDSSGGTDGYSGSLYGMGHNQRMRAAEIGIPAPVISAGTNLADLNIAPLLRDFGNIRTGIPALEQLYNNSTLLYAGLEYLPAQGTQSSSRLYACFGAHFHEPDGPQYVPSHMWTDLALGDNQGAWWISTQSLYSVNDYLFEIPASWADANSSTSGRYLATGRYRDGGWSGQGPALFAIAPWQSGNPPPAGTTLAAMPLLLYSNTRGEDSTQFTMNNYHHADEWSGGAWLTAGSNAAIIFIGTKGQGACWYGYSDGTVYPTDGSEGPAPPPYPNNDRGWWSTSFQAQMLFYSPEDLAAVAGGTLASYQPQPYAVLNLDPYLWHIDKINHPDFNVNQNKYRLGACAFDRSNGRLYIVEYRGDVENDRPLIHVFTIN